MLGTEVLARNKRDNASYWTFVGQIYSQEVITSSIIIQREREVANPMGS
jgi:hypothetical protein